MTGNSTEESPELTAKAGDDQQQYPFQYGHGRMPLFMKLVWFAFLAFTTWYVVTFLLDAFHKETGA